MVTAVLPSNRGGERLRLKLGPRFDWEGEAGLEAVLQLDGRHFDGDHERDLLVRAEGVCLSVRALVALHQALRDWLSLPLAELASTALSSKHSLSLHPHQQLDITFGQRADTISEGHPVCTITYAAGKLKGEYHLVTDQSCIRLFNEKLALAVTDAAA